MIDNINKLVNIICVCVWYHLDANRHKIKYWLIFLFVCFNCYVSVPFICIVTIILCSPVCSMFCFRSAWFVFVWLWLAILLFVFCRTFADCVFVLRNSVLLNLYVFLSSLRVLRYVLGLFTCIVTDILCWAFRTSGFLFRVLLCLSDGSSLLVCCWGCVFVLFVSLPPPPRLSQRHKSGHHHHLCFHSSGAVWESRWPSWAVRPNEPSGFCGRKAILNHASALVSACP